MSKKDCLTAKQDSCDSFRQLSSYIVKLPKPRSEEGRSLWAMQITVKRKQLEDFRLMAE